ncbi:MAG: FAD-dependent oxidoreductase [Candidatus Nezhaarchaeales archaeon]
MYEVAIVGGGGAGITAAIYLARKNLDVVLIEKASIGGQIVNAPIIENYPGLMGVSGLTLAQRFEEHCKALNVKMVMDEVTEIRKLGELFKVKLASGGFIEAKAVILAIGTNYRKLNVKGEEEFIGRGISYCATCDGPLFKGKTVAVVGGGNTAFTYALYLKELCPTVYLIHRGRTFKADEVLVNKAEKAAINFKTPYTVIEILGDKLVNGLRLKNEENGKEELLTVNGVFVAIGQEVDKTLLTGLGVKLNSEGYVEVDHHMKTNIPGLFACGDITGISNQLIVACGQGAIAALSAYEYVKGQHP